MKKFAFRLAPFVFLFHAADFNVYGQETALSSATEECLGCHRELHPGLVASWEKSRHSRTTPAAALVKASISRRVSSDSIEKSLRDVVVGCYECHSLRADQHTDSFEHNGYRINVIVSPKDCATCHSVEADQYSKNIMSHAYGNLVDNSLYRDMTAAVNNNYHRKDKELVIGGADKATEYESCLYCHGTKVEVKGLAARQTSFGELPFQCLRAGLTKVLGVSIQTAAKVPAPHVTVAMNFPLRWLASPTPAQSAIKVPTYPPTRCTK